MLKILKEQVLEANHALPAHGLVTFTWGNASGIDRAAGMIVIKPSGVAYPDLSLSSLVVLDLEGQVVEGAKKPSADTLTHLSLYRSLQDIGGIVHTHSPWATSWAQACRGIPPLGTTHGDYFHGPIPCTRKLNRDEILGGYEQKTGEVIVEALQGLQPLEMPGILVASHGPFTWGASPGGAVHNAVVLEEVAKMAYRSLTLHPELNSLDQDLLDKHFLRKHGKGAYYGQGTPD